MCARADVCRTVAEVMILQFPDFFSLCSSSCFEANLFRFYDTAAAV
jgi:hypothetical protein